MGPEAGQIVRSLEKFLVHLFLDIFLLFFIGKIYGFSKSYLSSVLLSCFNVYIL